MKKILVPVDFSGSSQKALMFALKIAVKLKSEVIIYHSFAMPYDFASRLDLVLTSYQKDSDKKLKQFVDDHFPKSKEGVEPSIKLVSEPGEVVSNVNKYVLKHGVNLVVMGTQGASGIKKVLIGSNTSELIKTCPSPILAIPEKADFSKINSILYATDHHENDLKVIKSLEFWLDLFNAKLSTLHVAPEKSFATEVQFLGYKQYLKKQTELPIGKHFLVIDKNPEKGIEKFTQTRKNAILVTVPHKKSLWELLFGKSVTSTLAYHTHLPILALRF
jgi:nucleotide-binding universal stress UspA family protein